MNVCFRCLSWLPAVARSPVPVLPLAASRQSRPAWSRLAAVGLCCLCLLALAGCPANTQLKSRRQASGAATAQTSLKHLHAAIDFANRMDEFEEEQANIQVAYNLNRWVDEMKLSDDWSPDPICRRLPREIREEVVGELGRPQFYLDDIKSLMQSVWCANIAKWVSREPILGPLGRRSTAHAAELEEFEVDQLTVAERLFDWTIRNVQLETTIPYPFDPVELTTGAAATREPLLPPPKRGIPGPGYQVHPWQALLYGRADSLARARVFIQLARQQGIDVVMLAFPGLTTPPRARPWLPAVLVRDQLYLFDAELGLAIPGPDGQGIATLQQIRADPSLLDELDVGTDDTYRVAAEDMKSVIALIDASAQDLSRRMQLAEQNLTGDNRLVLTVDGTGMSERLNKCPGVDDVQVWPISYETTWYETAISKPAYITQLQATLKADTDAQRDFVDKYFIFAARNGLVRARHLHFRRMFDNVGDEKGAKMLYLETRVPNAQLSQIDTSDKVQKQFGLTRQNGEREVDFQMRMAMTKLMVTNSKPHASYWLGLAQYDGGRPEAAVEWFLRRTLEAFPNGPWTGGARYNLGRTYEALGEIEKAREQYYLDESPQKHGNRLRARYLSRLVSAEPSQ